MTSTTTTLEEMSVDRRNTPAPGIHERRVRTRKKKKKRRVRQSTEKSLPPQERSLHKKVKQGCNKARKKCTYSGRKSSNKKRNIAKGTTDPRVEFISQVQTKILIMLHLQNLDQASTSKSQPNISLSIKLQNLDQT